MLLTLKSVFIYFLLTAENQDYEPIDLTFVITEENRSFVSSINILQMEDGEEFSVNLLLLNGPEDIKRKKQSVNASESVKIPDAEINIFDKVVIRLDGMCYV